MHKFETLLNVAKNIGNIEKVNMYDRDTIYISGKAENDKKFTLALTIEKEKENND